MKDGSTCAREIHDAEPAVSLSLDCIGLYCPEPLFRVRQAMDDLEPSQVLEVWADDPAAEEDMKMFAARSGHRIVLVEKEKNRLRMLIEKGVPAGR